MMCIFGNSFSLKNIQISHTNVLVLKCYQNWSESRIWLDVIPKTNLRTNWCENQILRYEISIRYKSTENLNYHKPETNHSQIKNVLTQQWPWISMQLTYERNVLHCYKIDSYACMYNSNSKLARIIQWQIFASEKCLGIANLNTYCACLELKLSLEDAPASNAVRFLFIFLLVCFEICQNFHYTQWAR